jgi:hypothetical protein
MRHVCAPMQPTWSPFSSFTASSSRSRLQGKSEEGRSHIGSGVTLRRVALLIGGGGHSTHQVSDLQHLKRKHAVCIRAHARFTGMLSLTAADRREAYHLPCILKVVGLRGGDLCLQSNGKSNKISERGCRPLHIPSVVCGALLGLYGFTCGAGLGVKCGVKSQWGCSNRVSV